MMAPATVVGDTKRPTASKMVPLTSLVPGWRARATKRDMDQRQSEWIGGRGQGSFWGRPSPQSLPAPDPADSTPKQKRVAVFGRPRMEGGFQIRKGYEGAMHRDLRCTASRIRGGQHIIEHWETLIAFDIANSIGWREEVPEDDGRLHDVHSDDRVVSGDGNSDGKAPTTTRTMRRGTGRRGKEGKGKKGTTLQPEYPSPYICLTPGDLANPPPRLIATVICLHNTLYSCLAGSISGKSQPKRGTPALSIQGSVEALAEETPNPGDDLPKWELGASRGVFRTHGHVLCHAIL